jgi:hypothetical protein
MAQGNRTASEQSSDEENTSAGLPKRYISWIPLIALAQLLVTVAIFSGVIAPYPGHEEPVTGIHDSSSSSSGVPN